MSDSLDRYAAALFAQANAGNVPSGILHWSLFDPFRITFFDGDEWRGECDQALWMQLYHELHHGIQRETSSPFPSLSELTESLEPLHDDGAVPIAIACYRYDTPKRTFVGKVIRSARKGETLPQPESVERILETKTAFFSSALLPSYSHAFDFLPYEHLSLDATFVVPRRLFLTNIDGEPSGLEIDFDDGEGFRSVAFDERVSISYAGESTKRLRLRISFDGRTLGATFSFRVTPLAGPDPDDIWIYDGKSIVWRDRNGQEHKTGGWAWIFLRTDRPSTRITNPMIFADGFGSNHTGMRRFWNDLDQAQMATKLRAAGKDLILVGYLDRSHYIQLNAMLVVRIIERIKKERVGNKPLVVAGASMGGLVTRYALLWMESQGMSHETATYLTYDTPHEGAWIPIAIQKFVHYYRSNSAEAERQSDLIKSPAAQQMLWAWTDNRYYNAHENFRANTLRAFFNHELYNLSPPYPWPKGARRYAVANGTGDGSGNTTPSDVRNIQWDGDCAGAWIHTQPPPGHLKYIAGFRAGGDTPEFYVTSIPEFDRAPGGMSAAFQRLAQGIKDRGEEPNLKHAHTCFIPSVSAVSAIGGLMEQPFTKLKDLPRGTIDFDDYTFSSRNTMHTEVTDELRDWVVQRCAPSQEES